MYYESAWAGVAKLLVGIGALFLAVTWLQDGIGRDKAIWVIFALVGVVIFAGGAVFGYLNQKQLLDSLTRFNRDDAMIDRYRMGSFKNITSGWSSTQRTQNQLRLMDERERRQLQRQEAKTLTLQQSQREKEEDQQRYNDYWQIEDDEVDFDSVH